MRFMITFRVPTDKGNELAKNGEVLSNVVDWPLITQRPSPHYSLRLTHRSRTLLPP